MDKVFPLLILALILSCVFFGPAAVGQLIGHTGREVFDGAVTAAESAVEAASTDAGADSR